MENRTNSNISHQIPARVIKADSSLARDIRLKRLRMIDTLVAKTCTPCRGGIPPLTTQAAEHFHVHARRIERTFRSRNFREAFALVQQVAELAEAEGHHPDISFGSGYVTVVMQTKKIKGLHENDFIMSAKIDRLFERADVREPRAFSPCR
jgi:4a-hydroxytetrahydrobiopterin dehydratase